MSEAELKVESGCKRSMVRLMLASRLFGIMPVTEGLHWSSRWQIYGWTVNVFFVAFTIFLRLSRFNADKADFISLLNFIGITVVERIVVVAHLVFLYLRRDVLIQLLDSLKAFDLSPRISLRQTAMWALFNVSLSVLFLGTGLEMAPDPEMPYLTRLGTLLLQIESSTWPSLFVLFVFLGILEYLFRCVDLVTERMDSKGRDPTSDLEDCETIVGILKLSNAAFSIQLFLLTYRSFAVFVYAGYFATHRAKIYIGGDASLLLPLLNIASIAVKEATVILSLSHTCDQASQTVSNNNPALARLNQKF